MSAPIRVDRDEFTRLYRSGVPLTDLAARYGVLPGSLSRLRKSLGLPSRQRTMTADRRARIEALLDEGLSYKEIHRTEGADMETLRRHFPGRAWTVEQRAEHAATLRLWDTVGLRSAVGEKVDRYRGSFAY